MDGIVHATYVTARMHRSTSVLLESGVLDVAVRAEAEQALQDQRRAFDVGMEVVESHAILTPLGQSVIAGVRAKMAQAA